MIAKATGAQPWRSARASPVPARLISALLAVTRCLLRCAGFAGIILLAAADFLRLAACHRRSMALTDRAALLSRWSRVLCALIGLRLRVTGTPPSAGLIVSNHLSYLDVLVYASLGRCVFVAKRDVRRWPVFGCFARLSGTIFVDRTLRLDVGRATKEIQSALCTGVPVVLFPEGTSSDGTRVQPFRSALLQPIVSGHLVTAAAVSYQVQNGLASQVACYWGNMTLLPHLIRLFSQHSLEADIRYTEAIHMELGTTRKQAALILSQTVDKLYRMHDNA